ncbi:transcriptional regulator [Planktothricoides sp. SR001]|uniref:helix-turn-helix domain-containing protein n=1 Tax=Planktothricoides sp. SR001 TaxID=1705388 RepID=UPI0006C4CB9A|nr:helix-turn-helix transcriptional regulator [Planktothricoides sp. SR001]KOR36902.1 transcriptional regulator [Planktothricoides sp. SR001]
MKSSLGQRLGATRRLLGLTQQQVIEQLKRRYGVHISQQSLSALEQGKRKIDAETELPALATLYGKPIHYFYESWEPTITPKPSIPLDLDPLTPREKLQLAAEILDRLLRD